MALADRRTATMLLLAWRGGDRAALDRLLPVVYDALAGLAHRALRSERADHTLQTRALVHEAYLRLVDADISFQDRAHFMASRRAPCAASWWTTPARRRDTRRRRHPRRHRQGGSPGARPTLDILDLHEALERLATFDQRKSAIVELHFFGGLSYDETAEAVGVSAATVDRELRLAKAWLRVELGDAPAS
jgi:RNA polymerase sigma factor (TIGR02999 family)